MRNPKRLLYALVLAFGCSAPALAAAPWNHDPDSALGPPSWYLLDPAYALCDGQRSDATQSPIDLYGTAPAAQAALVFRYRDTPLAVENTGHTIELPYEPGSTLRVGKDLYQLRQLHFHTPSEHAVDGEHYAMELHLVHANAAGRLAVVGVLFEVGETPNSFVQAVFDAAETPVPGAWINAAGALPLLRGYFTYPGSLTTPPCSEGVRWFVLKEPVEISDAQRERLADWVAEFPLYGGYPANARPVQPRNGRTVGELTAN